MAAPTRWCLAAAVVVLASCSSREPRQNVVPVKGKVIFQGKPLANAQVYLSKLSESAAPLSEADRKLRPQGITGPDGTFQLTTYDPNDGAPPGKYLVGVVAQKEAKFADDTESIIPGRYANPKISGVMVTVKAPTTELPPIEIADR